MKKLLILICFMLFFSLNSFSNILTSEDVEIIKMGIGSATFENGKSLPPGQILMTKKQRQEQINKGFTELYSAIFNFETKEGREDFILESQAFYMNYMLFKEYEVAFYDNKNGLVSIGFTDYNKIYSLLFKEQGQNQVIIMFFESNYIRN